MTGPRLAVALLLALGGGWVLRSWLDLIRGDVIAELKLANRVLGKTIVAQQEYIDYLEGGGDVVAEAENLLREPGT